jgi:HAD superfamily hydrolase (TIGR01490 family)
MNVETKTIRAAAFFDVDGTLFPRPSLESRFFHILRERKEIPLGNYLLWIKEALRLAPKGLQNVVHGNKAYLSGVRVKRESLAIGQAELQELLMLRPAVERAAWHASQGHHLVLVTGTLEPLALCAASLLTAALRELGCEAPVHVCATQLETANGAWSGRIAGEAIFGKAKAQMVRRLAESWCLDLAQCAAYGDSANDRWMLECVGRPYAVNPTYSLRRIARLYHWPVIIWRDASSPSEKNARNFSSGVHGTNHAPVLLERKIERSLREVQR